MHQNLALLLGLLLTKEQALLFKHQHARTIAYTSSSLESAGDEDEVSKAAGLKKGRLPKLNLVNA